MNADVSELAEMNETDSESTQKILTSTERTLMETRIKEHYDKASPYYQELWGQHIHHGLWRPGNENLTKEEAADQLVIELLKCANLKKESKILDVGCGVGGTSISLSTNPLLSARVVGISISEKQVTMANENAQIAFSNGLFKASGAPIPSFFMMNGEAISFPGQEGTFDAVWICEALSHFSDKGAFFKNANTMLKKGGKLIIADWFRAENLNDEERETIQSIEYGMLLPKLDTKLIYLNLMALHGFELNYLEDVSEYVSKTWDISSDLVFSPSLWKLAISQGSDFVNFLRSFRSMKIGYASRVFRYALFCAEKR